MRSAPLLHLARQKCATVWMAFGILALEDTHLLFSLNTQLCSTY